MDTTNMPIDIIECVISGVSKIVYLIFVPYVYLLYDLYIPISYLYMSEWKNDKIHMNWGI